MSVCGQTGPTEEDSASEEAGATARELHKAKPASKVVRVLTVLAYLLSVSLAAILLSVYYVCAWTSPEPPRNVSQVGLLTASRGPEAGPDADIHSFPGGSDTTVNDTTTPQPATTAAGAGPSDSSEGTDDGTTTTPETVVLLTTPRSLLLNSTSDNIGTFDKADSVT